jgi:predicted nucleic acid-binding Zn ribbon protein
MIDPWTGKNPDRGLNPLDSTLESVLERVTEGKLAAFETIKAAWGEIVTDVWRERSRPIRLDKGVLIIEVSDGAAASRLRLEQTQIKAALDERVGKGEVAQIKLRVGRARDWPNRH